MAELYVGAALSEDAADELRRIEAALAPIEVLKFDDAAARAYGAIQAHLQRTGRPVGDFDALIASIAVVNGQVVHTRNPAHFAGIPRLEVVAV